MKKLMFLSLCFIGFSSLAMGPKRTGKHDNFLWQMWQTKSLKEPRINIDEDEVLENLETNIKAKDMECLRRFHFFPVGSSHDVFERCAKRKKSTISNAKDTSATKISEWMTGIAILNVLAHAASIAKQVKTDVEWEKFEQQTATWSLDDKIKAGEYFFSDHARKN